MLGHKELKRLYLTILMNIILKSDKLWEIITFLNRTERLDDFLEMLGISLISNTSIREGKIVVIGQSEVNKNDLLSVAKELGIDEDRLEFCLDYDQVEKFNFKKLQYNPNYDAILSGPMPHSGHEKGKFSSILQALREVQGYPPVFGLGSQGLKITKSSFRSALENLISRGILKANSKELSF